MAVQDYGFVPLGQGIGNALMGVATLKQRDRALAADEQQNALMQQRFQAGQDEQTRLREQEQTKALASMIYEGVRAKEPRAIEASIQILNRVAPMDPQAAASFRQNPERLAPALERVFGIQPQEAAKPDYRTVGGALVEITDQGPKEVYRPAQRAPLPRPSSAPASPTAQPSSAPVKPLPTSALRIVDEANQAIAAASDSRALVDGAIAILKNDDVQLGAIRNIESRGRNFAGVSDENSRAFASIKQTLEKLRNNYLLLAKGVQTEGDATRAWNSEIGESVQNDNKLALQQLEKAGGMIDRALAAQQKRIDTVQTNFGNAPQPDADPMSQFSEGQIVRQGGKRYQMMRGRDGKLMAVELQ
jgi:hypothetical protein